MIKCLKGHVTLVTTFCTVYPGGGVHSHGKVIICKKCKTVVKKERLSKPKYNEQGE